MEGSRDNMKKTHSWMFFQFLICIVITNILFWYSHNMGLRSKTPCTCAYMNNSHNIMNEHNNMSSVNGNEYPPTGMWTVEPSGRLGNLIGQYATLYAFAKLHGHQAYILPSMHSVLSEMFTIKLPVINRRVADRIPWKKYRIPHNWMSKEYYLLSGQFVKLYGYPFSWTFYHHLREELIKEFAFHDFIRKESNAYLANIKGNKTNVTFVGVHVRRGDYVNIMQKSKKGVLASKEYLHKAMEHFRNKYENPLFMVTSNGMDWCKQNINNSLGDVYFLGNGKEGSPTRDFALLVHCNHTIMTIGTFGLYAAYLTGGETIYLTNYTLPGFPRITGFKYETVFLPEWIGIAADLSPLLKNKG